MLCLVHFPFLFCSFIKYFLSAWISTNGSVCLSAFLQIFMLTVSLPTVVSVHISVSYFLVHYCTSSHLATCIHEQTHSPRSAHTCPERKPIYPHFFSAKAKVRVSLRRISIFNHSLSLFIPLVIPRRFNKPDYHVGY